MQSEIFNNLLDELDGCSLQTLKEKNARYAQNGDCLHNFRSGAEIAGGTPAQACWGYLTKHLVALRDKVKKNDFSDRGDFLEKCQDTINYIRFLWCIGNDNPDMENLHEMIDEMEYNTVCVYLKDNNEACRVFKEARVEMIDEGFYVYPLGLKPYFYPSEQYLYKTI